MRHARQCRRRPRAMGPGDLGDVRAAVILFPAVSTHPPHRRRRGPPRRARPWPYAGPVDALPPANPPALTEVVAPGSATSARPRRDGQVIHVVRASPSPRVSLAPVLARRLAAARGARSRRRSARAWTRGAVAGINGDFFSPTHQRAQRRPDDQRRADPRSGGQPLVPGDAARAAAIDAIELAFQGRVQAVDADRRVDVPARTFLGVNRPAKRGSRDDPLHPGLRRAHHAPRAGRATRCASASTRPARSCAGQPRTGHRDRHAASGGGMTIGAGNVVHHRAWAPRARRSCRSSRSASRSRSRPGSCRCRRARPTRSAAARRWCAAARRSPTPARASPARQTDSRTSRSAVGQAADGTTLFVTVEGPAQGRPGMTAADQAAPDAVARARSRPSPRTRAAARSWRCATSWSSPGGRRRASLADVVVCPTTASRSSRCPYRVSPNDDRVDDAASVVVPRAPRRASTKVQHRAHHRAAPRATCGGPPRPGQPPA